MLSSLHDAILVKAQDMVLGDRNTASCRGQFSSTGAFGLGKGIRGGCAGSNRVLDFLRVDPVDPGARSKAWG